MRIANQLLCSLYGPKRSHACRLQTQQLGLAVGRPIFAISPQHYTRNELRRSEIKNFPGGYAPDPLARVLCVHTGTPLFKILDPPLLRCSVSKRKAM